MEAFSNKVRQYKVCWRRGSSDHRPFAAFAGERGLAEARRLYEMLLDDPGVTELELVCLEGDAWKKHVPLLRRDDGGEWRPA
jgi:hypothetical protein